MSALCEPTPARQAPQEITFANGWGRSGITLHYTRSRNVVHVHGWYDSFVGLDGGELPLAEFLDRLGIREADIRRAYRQRDATGPSVGAEGRE